MKEMIMCLVFFILWREYVKVQSLGGCAGKTAAPSEAKVKRDSLSSVIWIWVT